MKKTASKVGEAVKTKQLPCTSPSAKMSLNHLRPPSQMKIPSRVDLRQSTVDENILGVWSKRPFKKGEVFGPFMGKKVMDATEDMDPSYVWEIVDKETKEFLFYIDATDLRNANWMRYINCARHFDEQNIISEQVDVDIYYKVIKDIPPGEELLTWYKKPKLRKKQSRKRQLSCASNSGNGEKMPRKTEKTPGKADKTPGKADKTPGKADKTPGKVDKTPGKVDKTPGKADKVPGKADKMPGKTDKPLSRADKTPRKADKTPVKSMKHSSPCKHVVHENGVTSSKVKVKAVLRLEVETLERDVAVVKTPPKKALRLTRTRVPAKTRRKSRSGRDTHRRVPASVVVKPEDGQMENLINGCFQFNMKDYHMVKGRSGRRLYRCDICSSVYRHAFSLKRHYIRSHINYFFVSKMDRLNCNVSPPEDAATYGDMINYAAKNGLDIPGDGDLGEDGVSTEGCLHGSDVGNADAVGKSGSIQQEGLVAPEEPVCKRRKVSSLAEEFETQLDDIDEDKLTSSDCLENSEGDMGEKTTLCAANAPDGNGASDPANSAVGDKLDKENSTSDDKKSVGGDVENKSVGAPEENSSSTVDGAPGLGDSQNSALHEDADVCSATDENEGSTVKNASHGNGVSDPANSAVVDKLDKENGTTNADRDNKYVGAPEETTSGTVDGAPGISDSQNSALQEDADVCKGKAVKSASHENRPCILDQPSNKKAPGTVDSTVGEDSACTRHSAPDNTVPATLSSAHKEQTSAPDENGTDFVTCAFDKELNSSDKDNVKNSAADEKISKGNSAPNENKRGTEGSAEYKNTAGKMNGAPPKDQSTNNAAPYKDQGPENDTLPEDHGDANGMVDTESCSITDEKKSVGADRDNTSVGAPDENSCSTVDGAPDIGDPQNSNVRNVEVEGSSDMTSKTVKCSTNATDSGAADSAAEQENKDSAPDSHDDILHHNNNIRTASDDTGDISNELQDKQSDVTCDMSDVTKQSDESSAPLTSDGVALVYRCHICHCHLGTKLRLKHHLVDHSQDGTEKSADAKAFACDQCDMMFLSVQNLARHQTVHSGEKLFVCRYCNKKFPTVTNQRRHERIHQGRRFCCSYCQRSFTQTGDLKKHISKLHPELFHECVLCGKYFGSDDLLEEHLGSHGNDVRQNWKAVSMQRGTHRANLELDRAESMKLASTKSSAKFACTICRKLFDDYANMCRHRRLAHQRNSILNVRMGRSANRCGLNVETPGGNDDLTNSIDADESEDAFYARIAENISDNLTNFLLGKKVHLDNCYEHINEKLRPSSEPVVPQRRRRSSSDVTRINMAQYNFPKTFRLRSSRAIENCAKQDGSNEKDHADSATEQTPAQDTSSTGGSKAANRDATADAELMHVPKVRQCVQCCRNFHTFKSYREHMYIRHKTLVPDDANKSEDWRNEQPSSPPDHDRVAAPLLSHKLLNNSADMPTTTSTNKSKLSYSGWKNGLLTGVRKDACSVGDGAGELDSCELLEVCDLLLPKEEPSKDADIDKPFNYKLNLVARCYICNVCNEQFNCFDSLVDHQYDLHPNVYCTHLEVAVDGRPASWLQTAPVGLLRVTTNHVPAVEDFKRSTKAKFRCTKCNKPFASMLELHTHITECASEGMPVVEPLSIVKKSTKYKVKTIKGRKKMHPASLTLPLSPGYETFRADDLDASHDIAQDRQRKKRRKNFELLYNPLHHVRRRELTQVLEIHNCGGCHQQFKTISMLERHVRICKQKDKLKELRAISASLDVSVSIEDDEDDEYTYDPTKHMCIYCLRQFTYLGMLRKHVSEWCQVRQDFIDHGELLDDEWEEILEVKGKKEGRLSRQSSFSSLNGAADIQDAEEGSKKAKKPKWGTKWKCRTKQVDEPAMKPESESSTDSFSEQRHNASVSEESRVDDVESSQESHEFKPVETASDSMTKGRDDKNAKSFSCLLKPDDKVDDTTAGAEKDISESEVQVEEKDCDVDDASSEKDMSGLTERDHELMLDENRDSSERDQPNNHTRKSQPVDTAMVTPDLEKTCKKSQKHENGDNGKCKVAQSCDITTPPSNQSSIKIPKSSGIAKVM